MTYFSRSWKVHVAELTRVRVQFELEDAASVSQGYQTQVHKYVTQTLTLFKSYTRNKHLNAHNLEISPFRQISQRTQPFVATRKLMVKI